ncbi:MAG: hypothetical protein PHP64_05195 [Actinomycetota bacterium]|nr:hypothetical protein [Actinomycetota bacterium]
MVIRQISVFLENKYGRLYDVSKTLGEEGINIMAVSVADGAEYSVLRLLASETDKARDILRNRGFTVKETPVIAVEIEDKPGSLAGVLEPLIDQEMNVDYIYCMFEKKNESAVVVIRVSDAEQALGALKTAGFRCLSADDLSIS